MAARKFVHATVPLKDFLKRRVAPIDKAARPLDTLNVIAKVTFGGELFLRNEKAKRGYKGPLFEALPGDLIISKIRVGQGSFCVVDDTLDHVAVSPEYPVYAPDPAKVDRDYLAMVIRTPEFMAELTGKASGNTTKRRIRPEFFETRRIPLPPLPEQQAIVAAWRAALDHAAALERDAADTEAKAAAAFESALGFAPPRPLPDRPVFVANFKDLDRWSHEGILRRLVDGDTNHASPWPMVKLADVISDLENGWSPNCLSRQAKPGEWGVLKLGAVSFGMFNEMENKALPKHLKPRPELEVETGQILISRANVTRLVGAISMIGVTRDKLMLCDKIFRVVPLDPAPVDPVFLTEVLRLPDLRRQIESKLTGTSPTMKNISKPALLGLTFPLPPVPEQQKMVQALTDARASGVQKCEGAAKARAKAWSDFETAVYAAEGVDGITARIAAAS